VSLFCSRFWVNEAVSGPPASGSRKATLFEREKIQVRLKEPDSSAELFSQRLSYVESIRFGRLKVWSHCLSPRLVGHPHCSLVGIVDSHLILICA